MARFTWGDSVRIRLDAPPNYRPGEYAAVVGVVEATFRNGPYFDSFPPGALYTVEYADFSSQDVPEESLQPFE
jgi:hypothetical protein